MIKSTNLFKFISRPSVKMKFYHVGYHLTYNAYHPATTIVYLYDTKVSAPKLSKFYVVVVYFLLPEPCFQTETRNKDPVSRVTFTFKLTRL